MQPFLVLALGLVSLVGQMRNYGITQKQIQKNPHLKYVRVRRNAELQPNELQNKNYENVDSNFEPYDFKNKNNEKRMVNIKSFVDDAEKMHDEPQPYDLDIKNTEKRESKFVTDALKTKNKDELVDEAQYFNNDVEKILDSERDTLELNNYEKLHVEPESYALKDTDDGKSAKTQHSDVKDQDFIKQQDADEATLKSALKRDRRKRFISNEEPNFIDNDDDYKYDLSKNDVINNTSNSEKSFGQKEIADFDTKSLDKGDGVTNTKQAGQVNKYEGPNLKGTSLSNTNNENNGFDNKNNGPNKNNNKSVNITNENNGLAKENNGPVNENNRSVSTTNKPVNKNNSSIVNKVRTRMNIVGQPLRTSTTLNPPVVANANAFGHNNNNVESYVNTTRRDYVDRRRNKGFGLKRRNGIKRNRNGLKRRRHKFMKEVTVNVKLKRTGHNGAPTRHYIISEEVKGLNTRKVTVNDKGSSNKVKVNGRRRHGSMRKKRSSNKKSQSESAPTVGTNGQKPKNKKSKKKKRKIVSAQAISSMGCPKYFKNFSIFGKTFCKEKKSEDDNIEDVKESDYEYI